MSKTVKEIAAELEVSRQAVYQKIKKEPLKSALQKHLQSVNGITVVDSAGEALIKQAFSVGSVNGAVKETVNEPVKHLQDIDSQLNACLLDTIEILKEQLDVKDRQILSLQETISELSAALTASQALHAGTMRKNSLPEKAQPVVEEQKRHGRIYRFFFNE